MPKFYRSVQTDSYTCGVHSVRMVLRHFGYRTSFKKLKEDLGTTYNDGTTVAALKRVLRAHNLRVGHRPKMKMRELDEALASGKLALVHLDGDHFGVVYGTKGIWVYLADPSLARMKGRALTRAKFLRRWTRWALIVSPRQ